MTRIIPREVPPRRSWQLEQQGLHPLLARIYATRGIESADELNYELKSLLPPASLTHAADAAVLLIVADYDCDGATACAVGVRALRAFGADVITWCPTASRYGYGLSPDIVEIAAREARPHDHRRQRHRQRRGRRRAPAPSASPR
jgi:single-stranded-DNA-specific exonuclease